MNLLNLFLTLSVFVNSAFCNALAGPAQMAFFWNAYRMDVLISTPDHIAIGRDCFGSVPDQTCYFDEFVKHIQKIGDNIDAWTGKTSIGTDLQPTLDTIKSELVRTKYQCIVEKSQIMPTEFVYGEETSFSKAFGAVVDRVQEVRQAVPNWSTDGNLDKGIEFEVDQAQEAMAEVHAARVDDQSALMKKSLNQMVAGGNIQLEMKDVTGDVGTYEIIDTQRTLSKNGISATSLLGETFAKYAKSDERHARAIQACVGFYARLVGKPDC